MCRSRLFRNTLCGAIVVVLLNILSVSVAASDHCFIVIPEFPSAFESSRAVFIGEVVKISELSDFSPEAPLRSRFHEITFKVEYSWKGAGFQEIGLHNLMVLSSQGSGGECFTSVVFVEGRKYLVYSDETPAKGLIVNPGSRTVRLENASDDLKKLRRHWTYVIPGQRSLFDWPRM